MSFFASIGKALGLHVPPKPPPMVPKSDGEPSRAFPDDLAELAEANRQIREKRMGAFHRELTARARASAGYPQRRRGLDAMPSARGL
jgi:hypothetical protein